MELPQLGQELGFKVVLTMCCLYTLELLSYIWVSDYRNIFHGWISLLKLDIISLLRRQVTAAFHLIVCLCFSVSYSVVLRSFDFNTRAPGAGSQLMLSYNLLLL